MPRVRTFENYVTNNTVVLVLLCYERYAADWSFAVRAYAGRWQHGQWESRLLNAIAIRTRIVAIECGT